LLVATFVVVVLYVARRNRQDVAAPAAKPAEQAEAAMAVRRGYGFRGNRVRPAPPPPPAPHVLQLARSQSLNSRQHPVAVGGSLQRLDSRDELRAPAVAQRGAHLPLVELNRGAAGHAPLAIAAAHVSCVDAVVHNVGAHTDAEHAAASADSPDAVAAPGVADAGASEAFAEEAAPRDAISCMFADAAAAITVSSRSREGIGGDSNGNGSISRTGGVVPAHSRPGTAAAGRTVGATGAGGRQRPLSAVSLQCPSMQSCTAERPESPVESVRVRAAKDDSEAGAMAWNCVATEAQEGESEYSGSLTSRTGSNCFVGHRLTQLGNGLGYISQDEAQVDDQPQRPMAAKLRLPPLMHAAGRGTVTTPAAAERTSMTVLVTGRGGATRARPVISGNSAHGSGAKSTSVGVVAAVSTPPSHPAPPTRSGAHAREAERSNPAPPPVREAEAQAEAEAEAEAEEEPTGPYLAGLYELLAELDAALQGGPAAAAAIAAAANTASPVPALATAAAKGSEDAAKRIVNAAGSRAGRGELPLEPFSLPHPADSLPRPDGRQRNAFAAAWTPPAAPQCSDALPGRTAAVDSPIPTSVDVSVPPAFISLQASPLPTALRPRRMASSGTGNHSSLHRDWWDAAGVPASPLVRTGRSGGGWASSDSRHDDSSMDEHGPAIEAVQAARFKTEPAAGEGRALLRPALSSSAGVVATTTARVAALQAGPQPVASTAAAPAVTHGTRLHADSRPSAPLVADVVRPRSSASIDSVADGLTATLHRHQQPTRQLHERHGTGQRLLPVSGAGITPLPESRPGTQRGPSASTQHLGSATRILPLAVDAVLAARLQHRAAEARVSGGAGGHLPASSHATKAVPGVRENVHAAVASAATTRRPSTAPYSTHRSSAGYEDTTGSDSEELFETDSDAASSSQGSWSPGGSSSDHSSHSPWSSDVETPSTEEHGSATTLDSGSLGLAVETPHTRALVMRDQRSGSASSTSSFVIHNSRRVTHSSNIGSNTSKTVRMATTAATRPAGAAGLRYGAEAAPTSAARPRTEAAPASDAWSGEGAAPDQPMARTAAPRLGVTGGRNSDAASSGSDAFTSSSSSSSTRSDVYDGGGPGLTLGSQRRWPIKY
jgi:hypothetical protein